VSPAGDKNDSGAGISSTESDEVGALLERLREEVGRSGVGTAAGEPSPARRLAARDVAERSWIVSVDRPLERRPGVRGAALYPVKHVLRRLIRWYVEPFAVEQRTFNDAVLKLIDDLEARLARLEGPSGERRA
jgi:hypothetical protein